jgi:hypothetical protein
MRNKFTELVNSGVASFNYTNLSQDTPNTDPLCRLYNNIFSIPSDTHMSLLDDGRRVITGHMVNKMEWEKFIVSYYWFAVDFRPTGYWGVADLFYKFNVKGYKGELNGDVVYFVEECEDLDNSSPKITSKNKPTHYKTNESNIPHKLAWLTTDGNPSWVINCYKKNIHETVKNLNESQMVRGCNWVVHNDKAVGIIGECIYILE